MTATVSRAPTALSSHPDSDLIPSILYTPSPAAASSSSSSLSVHSHLNSHAEARGRTRARTYELIDADAEATANAAAAESTSSNTGPPGALVSRRSASLSPETISAHHSLPHPAAGPTKAILYLPPLLSPLPSGVFHVHNHDHEHEHEYDGLSAAEILVNFETRLPHIDPASLALHQALHHFAPHDTHYASTRYDQAFDWAALTLPKAVEREWYCVVFRSRRNPESSSLDLYAADRAAHEEAVQNGGLVMYWYGVPDHTGLNLATCIWQSRRHAINAISGPKHRAAMEQTKGAYEVYELERWVLTKQAGKRGLTLHKWTGGDVGW